MNQDKPYLSHDFRTLASLVVLMGGLIAVLWYFESTQGLFTKLAARFLTFN